MTHRLTWVLAALLGTGLAVAACSSDSADGNNNGSAGDANGGEAATSGSSSGGSAAGKAGAANGGLNQGGNAGTNETSAGQNAGGTGAELGGAAGAAGALALAGSPSEMAGAPGAAGAPDGAAGAPAIDYACTSTTWAHKLCSAQVAMNCPDPTECSDCVASRTTERDSFADCDACLGEYDKFVQCGLDAYEANQIESAFECVDMYGADLKANCYAFVDSALDCQGYKKDNGCPTSWPVN